jgi:hypothetical protein
MAAGARAGGALAREMQELAIITSSSSLLILHAPGLADNAMAPRHTCCLHLSKWGRRPAAGTHGKSNPYAGFSVYSP